jgi:hypothetical protein
LRDTGNLYNGNDICVSPVSNTEVTDLTWDANTNLDCERRMADIIDFLPDATFGIDLSGRGNDRCQG